VNESGEPLVEQTCEAGVHSEGVELESGGDLVTTDKPGTAGKPPEHKPFLIFYKMFIT
jgi:hypothetical protein